MRVHGMQLPYASRAASGQVTGRADSTIKASAVPALSSSVAGLCIPAQQAQQAQHRHVCSSSAAPSRRLVIAHANVRNPESAAELLVLQRDQRNSSTNAQWSLLFGNARLLKKDPLKAPQALKSLMDALDLDDSYLTEGRLDQLLAVGIDVLKWCQQPHVSGSLDPEKLQLLLEGAACQHRLATQWLARKPNKGNKLGEKGRDLLNAVKNLLQAALPSALSGGTVQEVLSCMSALQQMSLPCPAAFQQQLVETVSIDGYLKKCDSEGLVQVVEALQTGAGIETLSVEAVEAVRDATERLGWEPPSKSGSYKPKRQLRVRGRSASRGRSVSDDDNDGEGSGMEDSGGWVGDTDDVVIDRATNNKAQLSASDAAAVAAFFLRLPKHLLGNVQPKWVRSLCLATLGRVTPDTPTESVVQLCITILQSHQFTKNTPQSQQPQVLAILNALTIMASRSPGVGILHNSPFQSPHFPSLLTCLVDITAREPQLRVTSAFMSALAEYYIKTAPHRPPLRNADGSKISPQNSSSSVSVHQAIIAALTAWAQKPAKPVPAKVVEEGTPVHQAAGAAGKSTLDQWAVQTQQMAQRAPIEEVQALPQLLACCGALQPETLAVIERHLIECREELTQPFWRVLMPLAMTNRAPVDGHLLDVCLPGIDELVREVPPAQLAQLMKQLATAPWIGRSLMRDRLLAAAFRLLPRCRTALDLQDLVWAAGKLAEVPVSDSKLTRLTGISYDAMGMVPAPKPEEWATRVEQLFLQQYQLHDMEGRQRIYLLYSLCIGLRAKLSDDFISSALLPLASWKDPKQTFNKIRAADAKMLLELVQHWGAAPAACDWPLKLLDAAATALAHPSAPGNTIASALDCLGTVASPSLGVISPPHHSKYLPRKLQPWLPQGADSSSEHAIDSESAVPGVADESGSQQQLKRSPTRSPSPAHGRTPQASLLSSPAGKTTVGTKVGETMSKELAGAGKQPAGRRRSRQKTQSPAASARVSETAARSTAKDAVAVATHEAAAAAVLAAMDSVTATMMLAAANASASDVLASAPESGPSLSLPVEMAPKQVPAPSFDLVTGTVVLVTKTRAVIEVEGAADMLGQLLPENLTAAQPVEELAKVLSKGQAIKAVVLQRDEQAAQLNLSTREVEPWPGAMLTHPDAVFNAAEQVWAAKQAVLAALAAPPAGTAAAAGALSASEDTPLSPNSGSVEGSSSHSFMDPSEALEALLQPALRQYYSWSMTDGEALLQHAISPKQVTGTSSGGATANESDHSDTGGMEQLQQAVSLNRIDEDVGGAATHPSPSSRSPSPAPRHQQQTAADSAAAVDLLDAPSHAVAVQDIANTAGGVQANMEQHDHPALLAACRSLAVKLSGMLLTKQSMVSLSESPVLLAKAVHRLHQLGVRPGQQWLQDFEEYSQGFLPQIVEADTVAAVRMLWAVQQLGHTPSWLWVYTIVNALQEHVESIASQSPVELGTLLAALHASLTDPNRPDYTLSQPAQQLTSTAATNTKRGGKAARRASTGPLTLTDPLSGTAYSEAALRYFQPSAAATAQLAAQVAASWLKAADLQQHRDLLKDTHADVLPMAVQALACMHLHHDQLLYSLVQHRLPVASAYVEQSQAEAAAVAKQVKAKGAGGKAASAAAAAAASKHKAYLPNSVWLLRLCSTLTLAPGVLRPTNEVHTQAASSSTTSNMVLSLMTCVLSWQQSQGEGEAVPVAVRNFTQACMQRLAAEQDPVTGAGLISLEACAQLLDTFKAAGLELPSSLCGAYFKQRLHQQGFMAGAAALEHLSRMGRSLELWEIVAMVEAATTETDQHDPAAHLSELSHLLQQFLSFTIRRERLPVDEGWQERMQRLQQYLQAIPTDTINSSSLAASSWLSCCVSCVQLQAVRAACPSGQLQELESDINTVATSCLEALPTLFPQQVLLRSLDMHTDPANRTVGTDNRASVRLMHSLLALQHQEGQQEQEQDQQAVHFLQTQEQWRIIDPVSLLASYGTHPRNATVLLEQLMQVMTWHKIQKEEQEEGQASDAAYAYHCAKPPPEYVGRVIALAWASHRDAVTYLRKLLLRGLLVEYGTLDAVMAEADKGLNGKIPGLPAPAIKIEGGAAVLLDILFVTILEGADKAPPSVRSQHLQSAFLAFMKSPVKWQWGSTADIMLGDTTVGQRSRNLGAKLEQWAEVLPQAQFSGATYRELLGFLLHWHRYISTFTDDTTGQPQLTDLSTAPETVQRYIHTRTQQVLHSSASPTLTSSHALLSVLWAAQYCPPVSVGKVMLDLVNQAGLLKQQGGDGVLRYAVQLTLGAARPDSEIVELEDVVQDDQVRQLAAEVAARKEDSYQLIQAVLALAVKTAPRQHMPYFPSEPAYSACISPGTAGNLILRMEDAYFGVRDTGEDSTLDKAVLFVRCTALLMALVQSESAEFILLDRCLRPMPMLVCTALACSLANHTWRCNKQGQVVASHLLRYWLMQSLLWGDMFERPVHSNNCGLASSYAILAPYMSPSQVLQGLELLYTNTICMPNLHLTSMLMGYAMSTAPLDVCELIKLNTSNAVSTEDVVNGWRRNVTDGITSMTYDYARGKGDKPWAVGAWLIPDTNSEQVIRAAMLAIQQPGLPSGSQLQPAGLPPKAYQKLMNIQGNKWDMPFVAARSISLGYLGGGPDIAAANGQYDEVWRWSLLYGMAQRAPESLDAALKAELKARFLSAAQATITADQSPSLQVVLQWTAPLLLTDLGATAVELPDELPVQEWLEQADWTAMLGPSVEVHPNQVLQLSALMLASPDFLTLFRRVCASKVLPMLQLVEEPEQQLDVAEQTASLGDSSNKVAAEVLAGAAEDEVDAVAQTAASATGVSTEVIARDDQPTAASAMSVDAEVIEADDQPTAAETAALRKAGKKEVGKGLIGATEKEQGISSKAAPESSVKSIIEGMEVRMDKTRGGFVFAPAAGTGDVSKAGDTGKQTPEVHSVEWYLARIANALQCRALKASDTLDASKLAGVYSSPAINVLWLWHLLERFVSENQGKPEVRQGSLLSYAEVAVKAQEAAVKKHHQPLQLLTEDVTHIVGAPQAAEVSIPWRDVLRGRLIKM